MEKEAKYLSVAGVTRIINRHSVHLLTTLQSSVCTMQLALLQSTQDYRKLAAPGDVKFLPLPRSIPGENPPPQGWSFGPALFNW